MSAGSAIVLNASLVSIKGNPAFSVYSATKAALRSFARNWAVGLKGKGIRVTRLLRVSFRRRAVISQKPWDDGTAQDDYIQSVTPAIPLGRTGTTEEIAKASRSSPLTKAATSPAVNRSLTAVRARSKERAAIAGCKARQSSSRAVS
jgi:NAD(P)-dependent dehydrogenase (short-subunit alcohol dehydrogenase family)